MKSYLSNRRQGVKGGEYVSRDENVTFGVPQGSVLGPTLFLLYINDLCNITLEMGNIFSYADDTAVVFSGNSWEDVRNRAENGLTKISQWLSMNILTLNAAKTNFICFSLKTSTQPEQDLKVKIHNAESTECRNDGCACPAIKRVNSVKYLGITIDQTLSWHPHLDLLSGRIRKLIFIFKTLRHVANKDLINKIYVALAQSILVYCIPAWGGASKTKYLELERAQRSLLKVMHFKPYRFSTTELYRFCSLLSIRKLYILNSILKVHKTLKLDYNLLNKRRYSPAPSRTTKTYFARRQFNVQSAYLYNKINIFLHIYPMNKYDCKNATTQWLKSISYDETESFMAKIS